jgi:hypothetical protein
LPIYEELPDGFASGSKGEVHHLCNFHTWGLAATQQAASAAEHSMTLLRDQSGGIPGCSCTICTLLQEEEDVRIREFIVYSEHNLVAQWLRSSSDPLHGSWSEAQTRCVTERCLRDQLHHGKVSATTRGGSDTSSQ